MNYLYLHGFASGPQSLKARFLETKFAERGIKLHVPDLNLGNFTEVTVTAQLQYLLSHYSGMPLAIIGSSLGGFLAVQVAATNPQVERLVLMAPAFGFQNCLAKAVGEEAIAQWQRSGYLNVYNYGLKQTLPLKHDFWTDVRAYSEKALTRDIPIAIVHGLQDEIVPPALSQDFAANHANVFLELVESDHSLSNALDLVWEKTQLLLGL